MDALAVMDRAYERRRELLNEDDVKGVQMTLNPSGVTLTVMRQDGSLDGEFLARQPGE